MRSGWRHEDRVMFAVAAGLAAWGLVLIVVARSSWPTTVGVLLVVEGVLIASFRPQLRHAYNHGWMAGRAAMAMSLPEAMHRGLHPIEWIIAEAERDGCRVRVTYVGEEPEE